MRHRPVISLAAGAILLLAACSSGAPAAAPSIETTAAPTAAPTVVPTVVPTAAAACAPSDVAGEVAVTIKDFAFSPAEIPAKVGQTIAFTNEDSAPHSATLDDRTCTTATLSNGASGGLVFDAAGSYPFHCRIHPDMKGTITVS